MAALLLCALVVLVLIGPFVIAGIALADDARELIRVVQSAVQAGLPDLPAWMTDMPWAGAKIQSFWARLQQDPHSILTAAQNWAAARRNWFFGGGLAVLHGLIMAGVTVFTLFFCYKDGTAILAWFHAILSRMAGARAGMIAETIDLTVKGVLYGMMGTAIAQALMAWIGFLVAGVPLSLLWGFLTFFFSLIPAGPPFIWVPACIWLLVKGHTIKAILLAVWGTFVISGIDNVVKPYLISRGANMPFVLVLIGVVGGVLAFGAIGLFAGPVILAVAFALLRSWTAETE